jgi:hypothetical protein
MQSSFLGWEFQPVEVSQREFLSGFFARYPQPLSGFTFGSLASWDPIFQYGWILLDDDTLLISCLLEPDRRRHLMQPVGSFPTAVQDRLARAAQTLPYPLRIVGVCEAFLQHRAEFVKQCRVLEDPTAANYVYLADSLARLPGRKYAKKRNLIAQAEGLYRWSGEPVGEYNTEACYAIMKSIEEEEKPEVDTNLEQELIALEHTLRNFAAFGQQGLLIRVEGRPAAFSIFEPISPSTVAIHFERALRSYKGLYQVINNETAKAIAARRFKFINREEDLGSPGLRDAKRSYNPVELISAYELSFRLRTPEGADGRIPK